MSSVKSILARGRLGARDIYDGHSDNLINLMIALLTIVFFGLLLCSALVMLRRIRRQRKLDSETLPQYHDVKGAGNHRRLTIETRNGSPSVVVFQDGKPMLSNPDSPPHSPDNVPEIHITFPDEHDDHGRRTSGRVVVVRVGENSTVGMSPVNDEQLPAYEKESSSQFYSIDMDQIGGLREKERSNYH